MHTRTKQELPLGGKPGQPGGAKYTAYSASQFVVLLALSAALFWLTVDGAEGHAMFALAGIFLGISLYGLCRRLIGNRLLFKTEKWDIGRILLAFFAFTYIGMGLFSPELKRVIRESVWVYFTLGAFFLSWGLDGLYRRLWNSDDM